LVRWARRRRDRTGEPFHTIYYSIAIIVALPLLAAAITGFPVSWTIPELKGFNFVGGLHLIPEFIALWIALTIYSSAFIAEIVRGGIQAIDRSQFEAAYALGLKPKFTMLLIIIPQALRIIIPPLGNMHITILKDSSLAAAIGYPDLMLIFGATVLSQTGQALEVMGIVMAVYLVICLGISFFINLYNRRTLWGEQ
jgi:general L-amino acid transport system permease protein